jgi:uncharacterized protein YjiS (DUF1127 family)
MHARIAKEELAILLPNTMSQYARFDNEFGHKAPGGLLGKLYHAWCWVVDFPRRRAVIDELSMLSDHELSDIGLTRADLPRVFDPAFASEHQATRDYIG